MKENMKIHFPIETAVIDDDPVQLSFIEKILSKEENLKVHTFTNSAQAIQEIKKGRFSIVVTDFVMPEHSGKEVVEAAAGLQKGIESIVISASIDPWEAYGCLQLGARAILYKPVPPEKLMQVTDLCIKRFKQWNEDLENVQKRHKAS